MKLPWDKRQGNSIYFSQVRIFFGPAVFCKKMLAGSRDSVPGRRPQTAKPAYRWIVYPTPFLVSEVGKESTPSHWGGGEGYCKFKRYKSFRSSLSQKACGVKGQSPLSPSADGETPMLNAIYRLKKSKKQKKQGNAQGGARRTKSRAFYAKI